MARAVTIHNTPLGRVKGLQTKRVLNITSLNPREKNFYTTFNCLSRVFYENVDWSA